MRRGYYIDLSDFPDGLGGQVQVRISTRWEDLGLDYRSPESSGWRSAARRFLDVLVMLTAGHPWIPDPA